MRKKHQNIEQLDAGDGYALPTDEITPPERNTFTSQPEYKCDIHDIYFNRTKNLHKHNKGHHQDITTTSTHTATANTSLCIPTQKKTPPPPATWKKSQQTSASYKKSKQTPVIYKKSKQTQAT